MTAEAPSAFARGLTWLVVALTVVLLALGIYRYGWSTEVHQRFWQDILDRVRGPMTFRYYLQPSMAALAALPDGIKDARLGHKAFFWTALRDPTQHGGRLREGLVVDRARRAARDQHGRHLPVQGLRPVLPGRSRW